MKEEFKKLMFTEIQKAKTEDEQIVNKRNFDMGKMWKDVQQRAIQKKRFQQRKQMLILLSIASIVALVFVIWSTKQVETMSPSADYVAMLDDINIKEFSKTSLITHHQVIEFADESSIVSNKNEAEQNNQPTSFKQTIDYNKLVTPIGKQANLTLADGTKVRLNSGSKLIYPTSFDGDFRIVAIEGEAFFDVAHNSAKPFIVKSKESELKVLGTSFCLRTYNSEAYSHVVLLEGSVEIRTNEGLEATLKPNQMLYMEKNEALKIKTVDTDYYVAWIENLILLQQGETASVMLQKIQQYYGISLQFDKEIGSKPVIGKILLEKDVDRVMYNVSRLLNVQLNKQDDSYRLTRRT